MISFLFNWYLILFPVILPTILYIIIFREFPIPNPKKDMKQIGLFVDWMIDNAEQAKIEKEQQKGARKYNPDDFWEEVDIETGEVGADAGPRIRYPKNRDRAYSGSVERFHDGGGQDT